MRRVRMEQRLGAGHRKRCPLEAGPIDAAHCYRRHKVRFLIERRLYVYHNMQSHF